MQVHHSMKTDLSSYNNNWYHPGSSLKRFVWHFINAFVFKTGLFPFYGIKTFLLKAFGAKVGVGVAIKPYVNIKYPWFLEVGDHVWIGENVWIDNLAKVTIGSHVCISQGAYLLTGNHNFKRPTFDLIIGAITLEDGAWVGAQTVVCPGVTCGSHSVLTVGSVATKNLDPYFVYRGNPAAAIKKRDFDL